MSFLFENIYIFFIALSFLVSLSVYINPRPGYPYLKLFPPYLLATCIVETTGAYLGSIGVSNLWLYNIFSIIEFCFYIWVIGVTVRSPRVKKIIPWTIALYTVIAIVDMFFIQKIRVFHTITYCLGCLMLISFCIYYFLELFRYPKSIKLVNEPAFWICTGILFFYSCGFPLYGFMNYWPSDSVIIDNFTFILNMMNIFLYSLFMIAFLCQRPRKYTSSPSSG